MFQSFCPALFAQADDTTTQKALLFLAGLRAQELPWGPGTMQGTVLSPPWQKDRPAGTSSSSPSRERAAAEGRGSLPAHSGCVPAACCHGRCPGPAACNTSPVCLQQLHNQGSSQRHQHQGLPRRSSRRWRALASEPPAAAFALAAPLRAARAESPQSAAGPHGLPPLPPSSPGWMHISW